MHFAAYLMCSLDNIYICFTKTFNLKQVKTLNSLSAYNLTNLSTKFCINYIFLIRSYNKRIYFSYTVVKTLIHDRKGDQSVVRQAVPQPQVTLFCIQQ